MQSSKPSKKTSKQANETVTPAQDVKAAEVTSKPRAARSSKTKKSEPVEAGTVKHHHKTASSLVAEPVVLEVAKETTFSSVAAPTANRIEIPSTPASVQAVTHAQIAELAYSYWLERGCADGSAEADWLRAERELLESR
jgi:hypothetical protein